MKTSNPGKIKAFGRQVDNYDDAIWVKKRYQIVCNGCLAKFGQNPELMDQLLATEYYTIIEASVNDKIWGIGLAEDDPRAWCKSKWLGQNLLGKAIMATRTLLRKQL